MFTFQIFTPKNRIFSATDAPELLYWVSSTLETEANILVIDLREVSFMDSSGLGALVIAHNRAQKVGRRLVLCSLGGQARMLFEISGMNQALEVYTSVEQFKESLQSQGN